MSLGSWEVNVSVGSMPEKVATAVAKLSEQLMGAEYTPIAYLGSQVVNGVNHAVLAEQLLITGKDTKNVVILIFNEKDGAVTLANIERVVESGDGAGGIKVDVDTDLSEEAMKNLDDTLNGLVGINVNAFAVLGTQVVKGINYIYAAEVEPVVVNPEKKVALVVANSLTGELSFTDLLGTKADSLQLGYAFTWLKRQNTSLGAPLGEWP